MGKPSPYSIDADTLNAIRDSGVTTETLEARLQFADAAHLLQQYITKMRGVHRVYPNLMSPQASGRTSVSDPPLVNFTADKKYGPKGIRDVVVPDPGTKWECGDWDAIEARIISHASRDETDLEAFRQKWDIHTVTAQRMFRWPEFPFEPTKGNIFKSDAGLEWCERVAHQMGWDKPYHDDHRFRRLAKNCRYALQYARDEKAMARYAVEMKMPKEVLFRYGRLYLDSKPGLVAWKRRTWASCWRTHEARTLYWGRRRRLVGNRHAVEKEGLNHIIQGAVADMLKETLFLMLQATPEGWFVLQSHDGWKLGYPRTANPRSVIEKIASREVVMDGRPISFPASWETIYPPGEPANTEE